MALSSGSVFTATLGPGTSTPGTSSSEVKLCGQVCDRTIVNGCKEARSVDDVFACYHASTKKEKNKKIWSLRYGISEFVFTNTSTFPESKRRDIVMRLQALLDTEAPNAKRVATESDRYYRKLEGMNLDSEVLNICYKAKAAHSDGRITLQDAQDVWHALVDFNTITMAETWTLRFCLTEFVWTQEAFEWIYAQGRLRTEKYLPGLSADVDHTPRPTIRSWSASYLPEPPVETPPVAVATEEYSLKFKLQFLCFLILCLAVAAMRDYSLTCLFFTLVLILVVAAMLDAKFWPSWKRWWL